MCSGIEFHAAGPAWEKARSPTWCVYKLRQLEVCRLRSIHAPRLAVPRIRTVIASRAFSFAAPTVWNSVSDNVVGHLDNFKK